MPEEEKQEEQPEACPECEKPAVGRCKCPDIVHLCCAEYHVWPQGGDRTSWDWHRRIRIEPD